MRELLLEIWFSISRNKLRTFLTGFSVAWGIFMLIILLASGNGLQNGIASNFEERAINTMSIYNGRTSLPYKGFQKWRTIELKETDLQTLKSEFPDKIDRIAAVVYGRSAQLSYNQVFLSAGVTGASANYAAVEGIKVLQGRFINETDMSEKRKVLVIDELTAKTLFKDEPPLGKIIEINSLNYTVVGVYKNRNYWGYSDAYAPSSLVSAMYHNNDGTVQNITIAMKNINSIKECEKFEKEIRACLAAVHTYDPKDGSAINTWSSIENYLQNMGIFSGIYMFIWVIGIGTLTAGIVGVSNIMLVTVRERTAEFGIRKALGAKPFSLITLVLVESVIITAFFGYIGMIGGIGIMELVNLVMLKTAGAPSPDNITLFKNPTVDLSVAVSATIVLIVAGMVAGYMPARKAATIKTVDAMRFNK